MTDYLDINTTVAIIPAKGADVDTLADTDEELQASIAARALAIEAKLDRKSKKIMLATTIASLAVGASVGYVAGMDGNQDGSIQRQLTSKQCEDEVSGIRHNQPKGGFYVHKMDRSEQEQDENGRVVLATIKQKYVEEAWLEALEDIEIKAEISGEKESGIPVETSGVTRTTNHKGVTRYTKIEAWGTPLEVNCKPAEKTCKIYKASNASDGTRSLGEVITKPDQTQESCIIL